MIGPFTSVKSPETVFLQQCGGRPGMSVALLAKVVMIWSLTFDKKYHQSRRQSQYRMVFTIPALMLSSRAKVSL
jgi:hypothetical protein